MITLNNKLFLSLGVFWFYYFLRKNNALVHESGGSRSKKQGWDGYRTALWNQ